MPETQPKDAKPGDQITIALAEDPSGALRLLSVDLDVNSLHANFSARPASTIDRIFKSEFARAIRCICHGLPGETQIVTAPDFRMQACGLVLQGYTLLVSRLDDDLRRFTIRLGRASGDGLALLKLGDTPEDEKEHALIQSGLLNSIDRHIAPDRLFDAMLSHLYLPLVNLNTYMRSVLGGQSCCSVEEFSASAVQLKARAESLQFAFDRMISEMMVARVSPQEPLPLPSYALHEDPAPVPCAPGVRIPGSFAEAASSCRGRTSG